MKFLPHKIGLYLDWRTQEVGIAAARSGDERLSEDYLSGDIYHALARMCGLTPLDIKSWKATPEGKMQRQRMKALQLGINYGMGVMSLSRGLGRHPMIGSEVIIRHQQRYHSVLALARRYGATRDVGTRNPVRVRRLAVAYQPLAQQAHTVQFSNAIRRRLDAAVGHQPAVRRWPGTDHAGS